MTTIRKPIPVTDDNQAAIEQALSAVNGRAHDHAYTEYSELAALAESAEKRALELLGAKKYIVGATWTETSGGAVNNTYARAGFSRIGTRVVLQRKSSGWYLIDANRQEIRQQGGGKGRLTFTAAQAARALDLCRAQFSVFQTTTQEQPK